MEKLDIARYSYDALSKKVNEIVDWINKQEQPKEECKLHSFVGTKTDIENCKDCEPKEKSLRDAEIGDKLIIEGRWDVSLVTDIGQLGLVINYSKYGEFDELEKEGWKLKTL